MENRKLDNRKYIRGKGGEKAKGLKAYRPIMGDKKLKNDPLET